MGLPQIQNCVPPLGCTFNGLLMLNVVNSLASISQQQQQQQITIPQHITVQASEVHVMLCIHLIYEHS